MYQKLQNGYIAEEKFVLECLSRNIPVCRPIFNVEPYDFIVELVDGFVSIQVKKAWVDYKKRNIVCLKTSYPRSKQKYIIGQKSNVDFLAIITDEQEWYIIPRTLIVDKYNICVSHKGNYRQYYNNWEFFKSLPG